MKKKVLTTVILTVILLSAITIALFLADDNTCREDPVEAAMRSLAEYTEEGYLLYLSDDGSYYTFRIGKCTDKDIVIPAYYNNIPITKISSQAFHGHYDIESVSIPDTVTTVDLCLQMSDITWESLTFNKYRNGCYLGNDENPYHVLMYYYGEHDKKADLHPDTKVIAYGALAELENLNEVNLPQGLESIGIHAFLRCKSLKYVDIPDSVTHVGEYTFSQCESLENVTLGSGITEISDRMFSDCSSLTRVKIRGKITRIGDSAFSSAVSLKDFEIPKSVTEIADNAFNNRYNKDSSLKNVIIHKGVKSISMAAFPETVDYNEYMGGLYLGDGKNPYLYLVGIKDKEAESLVLHPDTYSIVQQITPMTTALKSLSVEGGKGKYLYSDGNCIIRKEDKALLCGIGSSVIPSKGISEIAPYAFYKCTTLKSAIISDSVKIIGERAFNMCTALSELTIGEKVTTIGEYAFAGCESLESVKFPDSLYEIPSYCFSNCTLLRDISISENTKIIGEFAFDGCTSLENIPLGNVPVIGNCAFHSCKSLVSVTLSNELGYIGASAFNNCRMLKDIVLPYGLRYIGSNAFASCTSLEYLEIPPTVEKYLNANIYRKCSSLISLTVPEGVTSLSPRSFELCKSLKTIYLPSTLKTIEGYAVLGLCESIEEIVFNGTVEQWNSIEKSEVWYIATPAFTVKCTDGEVEYPANTDDYVADW